MGNGRTVNRGSHKVIQRAEQADRGCCELGVRANDGDANLLAPEKRVNPGGLRLGVLIRGAPQPGVWYTSCRRGGRCGRCRRCGRASRHVSTCSRPPEPTARNVTGRQADGRRRA